MATPLADVTETGTFDFVVVRTGNSRGEMLKSIWTLVSGLISVKPISLSIIEHNESGLKGWTVKTTR